MITSEVEKRLSAIEATITGLSGQQGPPAVSRGELQTLQQIACKVNTIEQRVVVNAPSPNPPGPQPNKQKTEGSVAMKKGKEIADLPWYEAELRNSSTARLVFWSAMITTGKWGPVTADDKTIGLAYANNPDRDVVTDFIRRSINTHFRPGGSGQFPSPPASQVPLIKGWAQSFNWTISDQEGQTVSCDQKKCVYAPGRGIKSKVTVPAANTSTQPATRPNSAPVNPPPEQPWETVRGGSAANKSFVQAAASDTKGKVTGPQQKYGNVAMSKFMSPPPKVVPKRSRSYGKRYILKYGRNEKPTQGTALPIQVIVSEINRTCSQLNVKANSAEWTIAMNLQIYFTHDSLDSQIEKARATILGVLAKGCPKAIFMKSVKWSRVVVRDVPTTRWQVNNDGMIDEDTGAPHGNFVKVTKQDIETELRASHPLLSEATFVEGPDWTSRTGQPDPDSPTANVSFTIPDPDESRVKALTSRPLIIFHTPCRLSQWTEKINLIQCTCCWKFGDKVHPNCQVRCRRCGGHHSQVDHHRECKLCEKADGINHEDRKNGHTTCGHPKRCPNCTE